MKLRTQILAIVAVPLIGVGVLALGALDTAYAQLRALREVETAMRLTVTVGDLVHEMQVERGMSAGFLASKGANFAADLPEQRARVDARRAALEAALPDILVFAPEPAGALEDLLPGLAVLRQEVEAQAIAGGEMAPRYTAIIRAALETNHGMFNRVTAGAIGQAGVARAVLGEAKEAAGLERATGAAGFGGGAFGPQLLRRFTALGAVQDAQLANAAHLASGIAGDMGFLSRPEHDAVEAFRGAVFSGDISGVTAPDWFAASTAWIVSLRADDVRLAARTADLVAQEIAAAHRALAVAAAISGAALLTGVFGLIHAGRIGRALGRLGDAMRRVAGHDYAAEIVDSARRDEIGTIARDLTSCRDALAAGDAAARMALFKARAFTGSSAAMMLVDRDLNIVDYNPALRGVFADNIDELRARWSDFDPDALAGASINRFHGDSAHYRKLLSDPSNLPHVADISMGDARLQVSVAAILDDAEQVIGFSMQWRDVREERTNSSILNAIRLNQTMVEFDPEFRITWINEVFPNLFGWGDEALGKTLEDLFGPNEDTEVQMERLRAGQKVTRKVQRRTKGGDSVWVEIAMNPVMDRNGALDRVIEIGTDVSRLERARLDAEAERLRYDTALKLVVEELRRGLAAFAEGDLTQHLEKPFSPELDQLRTDYNAAREKLTAAVSQLIETSAQIGSGAAEISQASDDLARRTETQAATLEETAASLDVMTGSVRSTAQGVAEADRAVSTARQDAESGGEVVDSAVAAMGEIERSAEQIVRIIGVIDDISFQTNLLALNAGVEAARAGEAGRGFAVVASEVRGLAQRSSEAANEIKQLITTSTADVGRGVELVNRTGEALVSIVGSVGQVSKLVSSIAKASGEQSQGIGEINSGVGQLDQVTQQNAAMVEEVSAASHALRREADALMELVGRFRVDGLPLPADADPSEWAVPDDVRQAS